ncbi:MAG: MarR family winged helix-turn-helix transcriptional regulator [Desulfobacterales bacterium]|jgi:DNA-binding MarR family transcriptional regulator
MQKKHLQNLTSPQSNPVPSEIESQIIQLLLKCGHFLQRRTNTVCRQFGLKQQQFSVLNEIVWQGPVSQKELCESLLFEKSNVSKIVRILLEKELIHIAVAPGDRRLTLLTETNEGAALWKDCMQSFNRLSSELVALLSEGDVVKGIRLLKKLEKTFRAPSGVR